jgi:hypothetical protein
VALTGEEAFSTAMRLMEVFKAGRERIAGLGRASASALELHRHFQAHPVGSVREGMKSLRLSIPTLHAAAKHLVRLGILRELPTRGKTHLFAYGSYLDILNEEPGS